MAVFNAAEPGTVIGAARKRAAAEGGEPARNPGRNTPAATSAQSLAGGRDQSNARQEQGGGQYGGRHDALP